MGAGVSGAANTGDISIAVNNARPEQNQLHIMKRRQSIKTTIVTYKLSAYVQLIARNQATGQCGSLFQSGSSAK